MDRLQKLKKKLFEEFHKKKEWWGDDLDIFDKEGIAKKPLIIRKAIAFEKVCREMPVEIKEDEFIVGIPTMSSVGFGHAFPKYETDEEAETFAKICLNRKSVWGHHPPYYPKVLSKGLSGIKKEVKEKLSKVPAQDSETKNFYEAVLYTLNAAKELPKRYVKLARFLIGEVEGSKRKAELEKIARICEKVPENPAESFHEALQSVWFIHIILHSTLNYTSLGRMDQYLWPYYSKDIEEGKITKEYARELLGSFLIKFNERAQFKKQHMENHFTFGDWSQGGDPNEPTTHLEMQNEKDYTFGQSANHWLQNVILSGLTSDGKDATNELSHMIIELVSELELIDPIISVRFHKNSPDELIKTACKALSKGAAQPVIFNDDVVIPGMVKYLGIPIEEAHNYSNDGCWETLVHGRTAFSYGHIELLLGLEGVLNRGKSLNTGRVVGPDTGDPASFRSYDEFYDAFKIQMKHLIDNAINNKIKYYDEVHKIAPVPFLSAFIDDCLEKGKDLTQRGSRYTFYSPLVTGFSHCVDALAVIKKLVYEDKKVSMEEIVSAVKNNWEGKERLRQLCLNRVPKYGNDDDYVDDIAKHVLTDFCNHVDAWGKKIDWLKFPVGIGTFENYPRLGNNAGASPDGRFAHEAIASNYSPSVGRDRNGPTAVIKSSTKFDLSRVNDGCPVDLKISFSSFEGGRNEILESFVKSFLELGGNILTITTVSVGTLRAAQKEPEKYASLRVRLGGLTAYFVQLAEPQQEEYIRRTEHGF